MAALYYAPSLGILLPTVNCRLSAIPRSLPGFLVTRNAGRNRHPSIVVAAHGTESSFFRLLLQL